MVMSQAQVQDRVLAKVSEDDGFRSLLLANPRQAVHDLTGLAIPDDLKVQIHEENATSFHLVLPPSSRLTEAEMAMVFAAGEWACTCGSNHPS